MIVVKIIVVVGAHGIMAVDAKMPLIPAAMHAVIPLALAVDPGTGFGGLLSS